MNQEKKYFVEIEKALDWEHGYLGPRGEVVTNIEDAQEFEDKEEAEDAAIDFNIKYGRNGKIYARTY